MKPWVLMILLLLGEIAAAGESRVEAAKTMISDAARAIDMYHIDCDRYPDKLQQLVTKPKTCKNWGPDPYLKSIETDPWGHPLHYRLTGKKGYELRSYGADGKEGGVDENFDISLAEPKAAEGAENIFYQKNELARKHASEKTVLTAKNADEIFDNARDVLAGAEGYKENFDYGNAVHHANLVMGRVSLFRGKTDDAKKFLKAAAQVKGSPQLDSFGPNMSLAKELLIKKEKAAVLDYLTDCEKFWNSDIAKRNLAEWRKDIEAGKVPAFRGNLSY